jgi:class 3 adenylate cyclase
LATWASALNASGYWATVYDCSWRVVFVTDELRVSFGDTGADSFIPIGFHVFSAQVRHSNEQAGLHYGGHAADSEFRLAHHISRLGPYVLATMPGGRDALRRVADPRFADLVDELQPEVVPAVWFGGAVPDTVAGVDVVGSVTYVRVDDANGDFAGACAILKPAAGMSQLAAAAFTLDLAHLERMRVVERPDRRAAALLMADLEASSPLARRLSTAQYFAFGRRLVRRADRCIIDASGIVGRHAGDGVVAFFLADTMGSESGAARACITAARTLRDALPDIASRSDLSANEVSLRFGLHWGATLYMGRILTRGRSEVTALGDEVNEAARIEACATGGRILASKSVIERLSRRDSDDLGLDTAHTTYTLLADLSTATDKARRDAPSIAVCDV